MSAKNRSDTKTPAPRPVTSSVPDPGTGGGSAPARPWNWLQGLFKRRVRLERRGVHVHVTLEPTPSAQGPSSSMLPDTGRGETLRQAHAELVELLGRHAGTRKVMAHLSHFEQALAKSGSRAIERMPLPVLDKALAQLESLTQDGPSAGLAELRARMITSITLRSEAVPREPGVNPISDFVVSDRLEVTEASHSLFEEMDRSWGGQAPVPATTHPKAKSGS